MFPDDLFPSPRTVRLLGGTAATEGRVLEAIDASLPAQGYRLTVAPDGIRLDAADAAGRRYGHQRLAELRSRIGATSPAVEICDAPDFAVRAYMLDISRDRVPTTETLHWLVDCLVRCRINQLQLYIEHTFAYRGHDDVWRAASPITAEEMRALDQYCAERGIELVANQNCFGHMERWLRHPQYRDRAECPDGFTSPLLGGRRPPGTLAPTPANAEFALGLVREQMAALRSRRVNVGCDETFELGEGASSERVRELGRHQVFLEHLLRIVHPLVDEGCDVQFWGDMLRLHPEAVGALPDHDLTALVWNYEAPAAEGDGPGPFAALAEVLGLPPDAHLGFVAHARAFADAGFPHWLAPGTSTWNTLVGRWHNARGNLDDAARTGLAGGVEGYLITDWGDNGHLQPLAVSLPALAYGAAVAWCGAANEGRDIAAVVDRDLLGADAAGLGDVLVRAGDCYRHTGLRSINASPLWSALFVEPAIPAWGTADDAGTAAVVDQLDEAVAVVSVPGTPGAQGDAVRNELAAALRLARHGAWRIRRAAGFACPDDAALRSDLHDAVALQREAWLARSREGGLDDSLARLGPTLAQYG